MIKKSNLLTDPGITNTKLSQPTTVHQQRAQNWVDPVQYTLPPMTSQQSLLVLCSETSARVKTLAMRGTLESERN